MATGDQPPTHQPDGDNSAQLASQLGSHLPCRCFAPYERRLRDLKTAGHRLAHRVLGTREELEAVAVEMGQILDAEAKLCDEIAGLHADHGHAFAAYTARGWAAYVRADDPDRLLLGLLAPQPPDNTDCQR